VARVARAELRMRADWATIALERATASWAQASVSRGVGHSGIPLRRRLPVAARAQSLVAVVLAGEDGERSEPPAAGRGRRPP